MVRYWITMAHAATLPAHGALLAGEGVRVAAPPTPEMLTVGELAERIWSRGRSRRARPTWICSASAAASAERGVDRSRRAPGARAHQGLAAISGEIPTAGPAWVAERLPARGGREEARAVWLEAMRRPGLLASTDAERRPA